MKRSEDKNIQVYDLRKTKHYDIAIMSGMGKRESQQDSAFIAAEDENILAVVCDGMGGIAGGAIASSTAIEEFAKCYADAQNIGSGPEWLLQAIEVVDDIVYSLKDKNGKRLGAGTTLVSVLVNEEFMYWISVGDSRIYIVRNDEIVQATNDHNYLLKLNQDLKEGKINSVQYQRELRQGEALISYVGMGGLELIDLNDEAFALFPGDTILLCSDGLYRAIPEEHLLELIRQSNNMAELCQWMHQYIEEKNLKYQDNFTYILIRVNERGNL